MSASDAGRSPRDLLRGVRPRRFGAKFVQSPFDASNVPRAVVDQCDSRPHSNPFVLGKTFRSRLSRETANRRARAKALNSAST